MASNRHLGRIIVLQSLYEIAFRKACGDTVLDVDDVVSRNISRYKAASNDSVFIESYVRDVLDKSEELDAQIQPLAPDWPLDQIARIDHIVLQMGAFELSNHDDVPPKVAINEAVELAKAFGGENSSKFVNGVLGSYLKMINPEAVQEKTDDEGQENEEA